MNNKTEGEIRWGTSGKDFQNSKKRPKLWDFHSSLPLRHYHWHMGCGIEGHSEDTGNERVKQGKEPGF